MPHKRKIKEKIFIDVDKGIIGGIVKKKNLKKQFKKLKWLLAKKR